MKGWAGFKRIIKTGKSTGVLLAVLALLAALVRLCNYLVVDNADSYTRLTLHDFYEQKEPVDTLFLGSSHCYRAYDPALYEELTGERAYNLGSSSQNLDTSYYLLREAVKYQPVKKVYLDIHFGFLMTDPRDRDLVQANIILDYMRPSLNKLDFILHMSPPEHYTNSFFPFRRDWKLLGDFSYLRENLEKKSQPSYREYAPVVNENEYYAGKGYVWSDAELRAEEITWWDKFDKLDVSRDMSFGQTYLDKITELCREKEIELIFVTAPSLEQYLEVVGPYEPVHDAVQEFADAYGVPYLDFNMGISKELGLADRDFIDVDHLNGQGAQKVTGYLAGVFR